MAVITNQQMTFCSFGFLFYENKLISETYPNFAKLVHNVVTFSIMSIENKNVG